MDSGHVVQGPKTEALEKAFAALCGTEHAVATSSGTAALHLAHLAHGIGPGDEVITTAFTFIATVNSILLSGAKPVFVDVDAETFNIDPALLEAAITPRTKAIVPVHLYGQMADMDAIQAIANRHSLAIVEDAAQAVGATYKGRRAGGIGTGCFSLYATKNVMCVEGGMITSNDDDIAARARMLRSHGARHRYRHERLGFNYRMSDLHAAIGLVQMGRLAEFNERRRANAAYLQARLKSVVVPVVRAECGHVWHQFTVRLNGTRDRDAALEQLKRAGIGTGVYYPVPAHQQDHVRARIGEVTLPVTEQKSQEVFSLPVHPLLSQADLERIVSEVNKL
jgi:dTDP-4-amino-4,6-dideoxygalactose transaminase